MSFATSQYHFCVGNRSAQKWYPTYYIYLSACARTRTSVHALAFRYYVHVQSSSWKYQLLRWPQCSHRPNSGHYEATVLPNYKRSDYSPTRLPKSANVYVGTHDSVVETALKTELGWGRPLNWHSYQKSYLQGHVFSLMAPLCWTEARRKKLQETSYVW